MKKILLTVLVAGFFVVGICGLSEADIIIDFNSLEVANDLVNEIDTRIYQEDGFTISSNYYMGYYGQLYQLGYAGSAALRAAHLATLTPPSGTFTLVSIDVSGVNLSGGGPLLFSGYDEYGSSIIEGVECTAPIFGFTTCYFNLFRDVAYVEIGGDTLGVQIDNIRIGSDTDGDGILDFEDNCPKHPNAPELGTCLYGTVGQTCTSNGECGIDGFCDMNQADNYPPGGNDIGDACECEGDFDRNGAVDADDVTKFLEDFGRSQFFNPCP